MEFLSFYIKKRGGVVGFEPHEDERVNALDHFNYKSLPHEMWALRR